MKIVSNELKTALKQPTTQRKGRILVNGNYYEVYNVEYYADAYNEGNVIGNAIASQLDFDLPYMEKFETFKYYDGVWTGAEYEYVDMGTFTLFDEQDEDEFNKHITAFDNLIKFNQPFQDVGGYPKTLYQELENICSQAEVELQNASIPNGNFIVENNQFVEGENLKTVLKAIEQISGTYGIIKNDKLVLQLKNQTTEEITKNEHEPITWKRRSYGINQVILGMEDVQGEYVLRQDDEDIAINGVHKLVINDNPFVYTQQKREEVIDELFNQVKGFGYVPYDLKMEWLNYMDIGDTITIDGVETIILRMYGKSPKSLESEMSAPAIIDSAVEYSNNTFSLSKRVSRTEFGVDKNAREIQGIIETTETIQKEINPTKDESGSNIIVEDASNNPLTYLEIEGKSEQSGTPTPDTPVEIESVGYENLWSLNSSYTTETGSDYVLRDTPIPTIPAGTYILSLKKSANVKVLFYFKDSPNNGVEVYLDGTDKQLMTFTKDITTAVIYIYGSSPCTISDIQITKGTKKHSYIPYGKYGIEVETIGKNLFNIHDVEWGKYNVYNNEAGNYSNAFISYVSVKPNTIYSLSALSSNTFRFSYQFLDTNGRVLSGFYNSYTETSHTFENLLSPSSATKILISQLDVSQGDDIKVQLEENKISTEIEEYKSNTSLVVLNEPLRSLPNGVRDKAYIKNNKLYVDRYIGSVVLDGSENWSVNNTDGQNTARFYLSETTLKNASVGYCNNNKYVTSGVSEDNQLVGKIGGILYYRIDKNIVETIEEFKTWLSTNNVEIVSELATPVTEELGEIEMLKTLKGYNDISTTDELLPIINLTYVRDTIIADYVENHVAQLKITENEIKESVESVSSSVNGLDTTINRVEEITTDNSQVINVISQNITYKYDEEGNPITSEVNSVTTTTGFTFNADGMTIDDGSGFKAEHRADGTYYKDGDSTVGQYTKDGSKQKDLQLFGIYSYGMRDKDDTPMFIAQLYNDENGEECFGHFYNGGGY